jgi:hypothetical protein
MNDAVFVRYRTETIHVFPALTIGCGIPGALRQGTNMNTEWDSPITMKLGGETTVIHNAREAIHFLDRQAPTERGYLYSLARRRCEANIDAPEASKSARLAFHAAVCEIGMFPHERL